MLADLPNSLRKEAVLHIHRDSIELIGLFTTGTLPDWFVATIMRILEPEAFLPGDILVESRKDAAPNEEIFFLSDGICTAYQDKEYIKFQQLLKRTSVSGVQEAQKELKAATPFEVYHPGSIFGLEAFLEPDRPRCTILCDLAGPVRTYVLRQKAVSNLPCE